MALTACPECTHVVSDKASACPKCGAPIASARDVQATGVPLTTTQETAKDLKLQIVVAAILFWGGVLFAITAKEAAPFGGLLALAGMAWYVVTKIRIWWHHK